MAESCIYKITNNQNNKVYVGQTIVGFEIRITTHKRELGSNRHKNAHLQRAWNFYGEESFTFAIIEYCGKENIDEREIFWIKQLDTMNFGYNLESGGNRHKYVADSTKLKVSEAVKLAWANPEFRQKMSELMTKERREKLSLLCRRNKHTEEAKKKISIALSKRMISEETRQKLRNAQSNKSEETREKLRVANIGRTFSEETLRRMSEGQKKRVHFPASVETCKKIGLLHSKSITCITTGETFRKIGGAMEAYSISSGTMHRHLKNERYFAGELPDGTKLKWKYA